MLNYIKSEWYRILRAKSTYLFIFICSALLVSVNVLLFAVGQSDKNFPYNTVEFSFLNFKTSFTYLLIISGYIVNMLFGNEYKNMTMKNTVSFGIPRQTVYFGKLIVQITYSIIAFAIITVMFAGSALLLLRGSGSEVVESLIRSCVGGLPLLIFAICAANCCIFLFENTANALSVFVTGIVFVPMVLNFLGLRYELVAKFASILPWNIASYTMRDPITQSWKLYWDTTKGMQNCWISGLIHAIIITVVGFIVFRKKEIR